MKGGSYSQCSAGRFKSLLADGIIFANAGVFLSPVPFDVRFAFPRSGQDSWANLAVLQKASPYFRDLLGSGLSGTQVEVAPYTGGATKIASPSGLFRSDSDDEAPPISPRKPQQRVHTVTITDYSFKTYDAMLLWLHNNCTNFASLASAADEDSKSASASTSSQSPTKRHKHSTAADGSGTLPAVSPKSVYCLAHKLGLTDLTAKGLLAAKWAAVAKASKA